MRKVIFDTVCAVSQWLHTEAELAGSGLALELLDGLLRVGELHRLQSAQTVCSLRRRLAQDEVPQLH
jgi:hypothetical protein